MGLRKYDPKLPPSVHQGGWPDTFNWRDSGLLARTALVRQVISIGLRLREHAGLRVRQPLRRLYVVGDVRVQDAVREQRDAVVSELNVRALDLASDTSALMLPRVSLNFGRAGPVLRGEVKRVQAVVAGLSSDDHVAVSALVATGGSVALPGWDGEPLPASLFTIAQDVRQGIEVATEDGMTVALDVVLDDELIREGLIRDLIRGIQVMRKKSGLDVTDRIRLELRTESTELSRGIADHRGMITFEVLAVDGLGRAIFEPLASETLNLMNHAVDIAIAKVDPGDL